MRVDYVSHMGNDLMVVNAARVSFDKESEWCFDVETGEVVEDEAYKKDVKLIKYLAKHGHWTPFGHPQICLRMKAPVPIRTQCFKHKQGFIENEVSRRYVDDEPEFFLPSSWRGRPTNGAKQGSSDETITTFTVFDCDRQQNYKDQPVNMEYNNFCMNAVSLYNDMIKAGIAPEQARFVLPQGMYTEWYWTGSLAAYARFANLRLDSHAQGEVRDLAQMVSDVIAPLFPVSWRALVEVPE